VCDTIFCRIVVDALSARSPRAHSCREIITSVLSLISLDLLVISSITVPTALITTVPAALANSTIPVVSNPTLPLGRNTDRAISVVWNVWVSTPDTHLLVKESAIKWYPFAAGK
jgi:hypothetical protein